jgi:hypothetical protein
MASKATRLRRLLSPWLLVAVLAAALLIALSTRGASKPSYDSLEPCDVAETGSGYTYKAHFPGVYGLISLEKLINWNDDLFRGTMTMYKKKAMEVCSDLRTTRDQCVKAVDARRPPEPTGFELYNLFDPYISCPAGKKLMKRIGDSGDGGKWLCVDLLQQRDCVIFSLGSNGQYDFELDLLDRTSCSIYTFDCTYDGVSQHPTRHTYIKKCIGTQEKEGSDKRFVTLSNAARELGIESINLLKIDIEGYEFDEISGWSISDLWLPEQISIEVHHSEVIYHGGGNATSHYKVQDFNNLLWPVHHLDASDLSLFFGHLGRLGYAIVSREDNPEGHCCSEFLLLRAADWLPI